MKHFLFSSLTAAAAVVAHALPVMGLLGCLLLWASAHAAHLHGFVLLCGAVAALLGLLYHLVRLLLVLPRLWARWFR